MATRIRTIYPRTGVTAAQRVITVSVALCALVVSLLAAAPAAAQPIAVETALQAPAAPSAPRTGLADAGMVKTAVSGFNPENIISDALFYDGNAMTSAQIQAFLDAKIGACENGRCLNILSASISSRDAWYSAVTGDLVCSALQGGTMRVSELIYRVQVACGISAKAILVTLQKEQGLTTSSAPSDWNLRAAMGASCPDTAPCDPAYSGVGPQIVQGVRQLKIYKAGRFGKQPGVNYIGYNPSASCGGTYLNIQNYATAALYNYTPYQPNAASLAAGWGLGDGCSSYGNRNFFNYYTSWFGSPQRDPDTEISAEYAAQGGAATLGAPVSGLLTIDKNGGGYARAYVNGSIYWSATNGAQTVWVGPIRDYYFARGGADGVLGWPAARRETVAAPTRSGTAQLFTGGSVFASDRGSFVLNDPVRASYFALGSVNGVSGWPTTEVTCTGSGVCVQGFEGSQYVSSSAGAFGVSGTVLSAYLAAGGTGGQWGVPVSAASSIGGTAGVGQAFSGGSAYAVGGGAAVYVSGPIRDYYFSVNGAAGTLGFPLRAATCSDASSCRQEFQGGWIFWQSATGARIAEPAIEDAYARAGGAGGTLGARTSGLLKYTYNGGGSAQAYANGAIYYTASAGAHAVTGTTRAAYNAAGGAASAYGWPVSDQQCAANWCQQTFENATIVVVGGDIKVVSGELHERFEVAGGTAGAWGAPVTGLIPIGATGTAQAFANGSAYRLAPDTAYFVSGAVRDFYFSLGGATGRLGFPMGDQTCSGTTSCQQRFQYGWIVVDASGARVAVPAIDDLFATAGASLGTRGAGGFVYYSQNGGGFAEAFSLASVFYKPGVGAAFAVSGGVRSTYFAAGGAAGAYGWPLTAMTCTGSVCSQSFEGGTITAGR